MPQQLALTDTQRTYFTGVTRAAFANPFTDERVAEDVRLGGGPDEGPDRVKNMISAVTGHVTRLESAGHADVRLYRAADRDLLVVVFVFDAFHRFLNQFDALIAAQEAHGDEPVAVPFAPDLTALLARRGFSPDGIRHFIGLFYQMRRAYSFIDRGLTGRSPCMKELRRRLWNNVFTSDIHEYERHLWSKMEDFSTLLLGETGTGKGAAAAAIGKSGYIPFDPKRGRFTESFTRAFKAINLSQFSEALIESELFGHRKGAFTGALEHHEGILARCSAHGAIFLDEIGDASIHVQIKLLQVLQERFLSPVGSHEKIRFQGRVIAATNRPLDALRREGKFRDDFFYRLCSDVITVPPLRQRIREDREELGRLVTHVLSRIVGSAPKGLNDDVLANLTKQVGPDYAWPGNVREVEQAVRRVLLSKNYDPQSLPTAADADEALAQGVLEGSMDADALLGAYCSLLYRKHGTYEAVADRTRLDRRTAKKYILSHEAHTRLRR